MLGTRVARRNAVAGMAAEAELPGTSSSSIRYIHLYISLARPAALYRRLSYRCQAAPESHNQTTHNKRNAPQQNKPPRRLRNCPANQSSRCGSLHDKQSSLFSPSGRSVLGTCALPSQSQKLLPIKPSVCASRRTSVLRGTQTPHFYPPLPATKDLFPISTPSQIQLLSCC